MKSKMSWFDGRLERSWNTKAKSQFGLFWTWQMFGQENPLREGYH